MLFNVNLHRLIKKYVWSILPILIFNSRINFLLSLLPSLHLILYNLHKISIKIQVFKILSYFFKKIYCADHTKSTYQIMQVRTKTIQPAQWKYVLYKQVFVFRRSAQSTYLYKYVLLYYNVRRTSEKDKSTQLHQTDCQKVATANYNN